MAVSTNVLGMNARNFLYIRKYNKPSAKRWADNKLLTKQILSKKGIPTPKLIATFASRKRIRDFPWDKLPKEGFVIKPARGFAGAGIMAFKEWHADYGITLSDKKVSIQELETFILDILDGAHSLQNLPDIAFAEELLYPHSFYKKLNPNGLPDIRVIVLNHIPIMAMMRLPTEESSGKANLAQGALGIGIDIRTGITNHAYYKYSKIGTYIPGTKIKVRGIKIPNWDELLLISAQAQSASKLGFAGIDIVIDAKSGPMVLEVNARPGLSIQSVNAKSLRTRLERIENMRHVTPKRGVEVAKSLYAEAFSEKVDIEPKVIGIIETVNLIGKEEEMTAKAKIDTGADRTSIDKKLAEELKLEPGQEKVSVKSSTGHELRDTVKLTFVLKDRRIRTTASLADRTNLKYPIIIGRRDLNNFLVDPSQNIPEELTSEDS